MKIRKIVENENSELGGITIQLLDDTNKDNFVKEDGKIIVYSLENGKVVKIDKISTKEELAKFIK